MDYKSRLPIYEQLYHCVAKMAAIGALEPEEQLPSVRSVSQELGVNPNTVQKAYQMLERDGLIYSVPGKGSFLSGDTTALNQQKEAALTHLESAVRGAIDAGASGKEIIQRVEHCLSGRGKE